MSGAAGLRTALLAVLLAALAVGCNKRPADEAIQAAEHALASAPELEHYAPEEWKAASQILREARASYAEGRYTDALRAVQPLPDRIAAAAQAAARRKQETAAAWAVLAAELPARLDALKARLDVLAGAGVAPDKLAPGRSDLEALTAAWRAAESSFERGELAAAVAAGGEVKAKAGAVAARIGLKPAGLSSAAPASRAGVAEEHP